MSEVFEYQVGMLLPLYLRYTEDGIAITGLSVKVSLRDTQTGKYLDFNDNTWKFAGWVEKQKVLIDLGDGQYQYMWDSSLAVSTAMILAGEYEVVDVVYGAVSTDFLTFGIAALDPSAVAAAVWNRATSLHTTPGTFGVLVKDAGADIEIVKEIETGRWKILNNQLILYKADNVTEVVRFNLYDKLGALTEDQVFDRVKV